VQSQAVSGHEGIAVKSVALCAACYKGSEPEVVEAWTKMAFALGRQTNYKFKLFIAKRKRGELAANYALHLMEEDERQNGHRFTHVMWLDDDVVPDAAGTLKLLDAVDVHHPVVFALAFERDGQHKPAIWEGVYYGEYRVGIKQIFEYPENAMLRITAAGLCQAVFDRDVFDVLKKPYFDWVLPGYGRSSVTPDGYVCGKLEDVNIPVYCHTGIKVGHMRMPFPIDEDYANHYRHLWEHTEVVR